MKVRWVVYVNELGMKTDPVLQYRSDIGKWVTVPMVEVFRETNTYLRGTNEHTDETDR
jgi:hypothetical protein